MKSKSCQKEALFEFRKGWTLYFRFSQTLIIKLKHMYFYIDIDSESTHAPMHIVTPKIHTHTHQRKKRGYLEEELTHRLLEV